MNATPTRVDWEAAEPAPSLAEGNRVLESIGRQEALRALLAFSGLREQIRNRRQTAPTHSDWDLFQTERFVLDEVLQLICDRTQALTQADAIVIALAEGSELVCRATAGPLPIPRGISLSLDSEFLSECLESGEILRCDDSTTDARVRQDLAYELGARSSLLIPLRGRNECVGVLQAFSTAPWSFTDHDVRCFDLFAELVLAALRPEDQDRRFHWLSDVAAAVLQRKPVATAPFVADAAAIEIGPIEREKIEIGHLEPVTNDPITIEASAASQSLAPPQPPGLDASTQPVVSQAADEFRDLESHIHAAKAEDQPANEELLFASVPTYTIQVQREKVRPRSWRVNLGGTALAARPGLSVVLGLVMVATLFSAGVWWGMQMRGTIAVGRIAATKLSAAKAAATTITGTNLDAAPNTVTSPPAPNVGAPAASDNLLNPVPAGSQQSVLIPVPESKLAALPKITGVRHWSSSMGSTVVIDMEDQAPYEVHRLMSPERIYFDLHDTVLTSDLNGKTMDVGDPSLMRVRVAQPVAGVTRVVLDTKDGSNFSVSMESNPYRLVVELRDSVKSAATNRITPIPATATKPASTMALEVIPSARSLPAQPLPAKPLPAKTGKFRIVLDPGHGGWDLGTVGRQGLLEKDLVLDVTKRLGRLLQSRLGLEVMFTRTGDEYLPLDQRADFANQAQADLFVSVHANYSSSTTARGVETYYTNVFAAPGSKEVEKHADTVAAQLTPVSLSAGGLHEKIEESRRLAASVQRSLYATLAAKSPDIRDRGIKDSVFAVLTGTTMPAILTEISFVSSPADEHNLQSETYRQQIAEALYKGIARYQESSPRAKVAQLQPASAHR